MNSHNTKHRRRRWRRRNSRERFQKVLMYRKCINSWYIQLNFHHECLILTCLVVRAVNERLQDIHDKLSLSTNSTSPPLIEHRCDPLWTAFTPFTGSPISPALLRWFQRWQETSAGTHWSFTLEQRWESDGAGHRKQETTTGLSSSQWEAVLATPLTQGGGTLWFCVVIFSSCTYALLFPHILKPNTFSVLKKSSPWPGFISHVATQQFDGETVWQQGLGW